MDSLSAFFLGLFFVLFRFYYLLLSEFEPYSYEKESDWINSSLYPKAPLGDWPDCGLDVIRAEPTLGTHLVR